MITKNLTKHSTVRFRKEILKIRRGKHILLDSLKITLCVILFYVFVLKTNREPFRYRYYHYVNIIYNQ